MILKIGEREITCRIKYKKIKHAYLKLNPKYELEISLPRNKPIKVKDLIAEKEMWLLKKMKDIDSSIKLFDKDNIYYKGNKYKIKVIKDMNPGIKFSGNCIEVHRFGKKKTENMLKEFIACKTMKYVLKKTKEISLRTGLFPKSVSLKNMKSFGHCTIDGKIFFNSKLICLPPELIDYVVCHELLHLKYFNHSKKFKEKIETYFPEHKKLENKLKKYYW